MKKLLVIPLAAVLAGCVCYKSSVAEKNFGTTRRGEAVKSFTLRNSKGAEIVLLDYGARVKSLKMPDRNGVMKDVTIGFDSVADYENHDNGINAVIGRFANRVGDGKFKLDGKEYKLFLNNGPEKGKPVCSLHGGKSGFSDKVWQAKQVTCPCGAIGVEFTYVSPDGEEGYPGTMTAKVRYFLTEDNVWRAEYEATVDGKATVFNLTNHIYFNLRGDDEGDTLDQPVQIFADYTTPVDVNLIPSGKLAPVKGTPFDFNKPMGQGVHCKNFSNEQLKFGGGYDHNWVLRKTGKLDEFGNSVELEKAAAMSDPQTGRRVEVWTNEPGLQMWGGQALADKGPNRYGKLHTAYGALVFETQHFPDSPNHANFPKAVLRPGETYKSVTEFRFFAD